MDTLSKLMISAVAAVGSAAPVSAAIFSDDFNGRAGALTGQVADTGQTWTNFTFFGADPSFTVSTDYGNGGTEGAGTKGHTGPNAFAGNSVSFTGVSAGLVRFEADLTTLTPSFSSSSTPLHQFWLNDPVNGTNASLNWETGAQRISFEGLGFSDPTHLTGQAGNAQMHVILDLDLTNKTASYSWSGVDSSSNPFSGSVNLGTYTANFAPSRLHIWGRGQSDAINSGWDNINYSEVPEPASIALLGLAGLATIGRRVRGV